IIFLDGPLKLRTFDWPGPEAKKEVGYWNSGLLDWLMTVDHKKIGIMYFIFAFFYFLVCGVLALFIRAELAIPGLQILSADTYNQFFSMHGTTMIFLAIIPMLAGLSNYIVPLQIGARDMAFPRLNAFALWMYFFSGILFYLSFFYEG